MTRLKRHDQSVTWEDDGAVFFDDILEEFKKKKFNGQLTIACLFWRKEEDQRKGFSVV